MEVYVNGAYPPKGSNRSFVRLDISNDSVHHKNLFMAFEVLEYFLVYLEMFVKPVVFQRYYLKMRVFSIRMAVSQ